MTAVAEPSPAAGPLSGWPDPGRCLVMGVLNVTPDSFSDGGVSAGTDAAVARGLDMAAGGADIVDVGGESTRPGAVRVSEDEERRRVLPVVAELAASGAAVSVDTMRAGVAEAAVSAGAAMVNDVSGGQADPRMAPLVAAAGVPYVLMHWRGHSDRMSDLAHYDDVVSDVVRELRRLLDAAVAAGVHPDQVVLDPGLGFAKTADHNWSLLAGLPGLARLGRPVLVGASRKSFLGSVLADDAGRPRPVTDREAATTAVTTIAALAGAWAVRVHDVRAAADAVRVVAALRKAEPPAAGRP